MYDKIKGEVFSIMLIILKSPINIQKNKNYNKILKLISSATFSYSSPHNFMEYCILASHGITKFYKVMTTSPFRKRVDECRIFFPKVKNQKIIYYLIRLFS